MLVLTTYDLDQYVYGALKAGAAGFLLKATPPDRLVQGIETVAAGRHCSHRTSPASSRCSSSLRGRSNEEIAAGLVVADATIKAHLNWIVAKAPTAVTRAGCRAGL